MATNFDFKSTNKGYVPDVATPLDIRTVVETFNDISSIPNPFLGMQVYVKDEDTMYILNEKCITTNAFGDVIVKDNYVDNAVKIATANNVTDLLNAEDFKGDQGEVGPQGPQGEIGPQGPQGPKGEGAQVAIKGRFDTLSLMANEWSEYRKGNYVYGQTNKFHSEVVSGDGYIIEETGHLYVYFTDSSDFNIAWTDAGVIKGDSVYLYIAFSDYPDGTDFVIQSDNTVPKRYIAIKYSDKKLDTTQFRKTDFQWALWNGEDGWGYEQVFLLSKENITPNKPTSSNPVANDLPAHNGSSSNVKGTDNNTWADHPLSVSEEWPLCWVITRSAGKTYSEWKGPSVYSRYAKDGADGKDGVDGTSPIYLELSNDQAVIPVESDGTIDPDFDDVVTTTMTLYEGSNPITNGVTYSIENNNYGTIKGSTITFNKNSFKDWYTVKCIATYNGESYSKNFHLVKTPNAYEIDTNTSILVKGENKWINVDKLTASVKKWDGTKWIASDKKIFIDYYKSDGSKEGPITYTSGVSFKDCISIELFVTDDNTSTGNKISKETIGVISDGKDGIDGSAGYTYKTSYVFTRSVNTPNKPSGGNYSNPKPDEDIWEDSVPNGQDPVWMSFRTFAFNDIYFTDDWSDPVQLSNQTGFQVVYTDDDKVIGETYTPRKLQNNQSIEDWINNETNVKWFTNLPNATYMATSIFTGKEWTAWSIVKIKGEKGAQGDRGADGTSVTIKGSVANKEELVGKYEPTLVLGDSYLDSEGYLWVYQGSEEPVTADQSKIFKDTTNNVYWLNVGKIQGPAGVSSYLYVKHSNDDSINKSFLDPGVTGKYIGFYYSNKPMTDEELAGVKDKFVWTKWSGQDGFGWEQIYCLSNTNYDNGPLLADIEKTSVGVVPNGWSDIPLQPNENNPYCWEARRKVTGDEVGEWIGGSKERARLFDRYVTNGVDGLSIEWKGELATAPSDPKLNWCYKNTTNNIIYIYDGSDWKPMVHDGNDGVNGANGTDGNSVFITYNDNAPDNEPKKPTGDGTTDDWHTNATKESNWMSQKVAKSADEGEWGGPIRICGLDGQDGSDAYYIELSRDHIVLPLENGTIDTAAENVEIEIHMFYGSTPMSSSNNVIYSCDAVQGISCDAETGVVTINPGALKSQPKSVKCYASHEEITLSKTLEIEYKEHAYKMDVSKTILERNVADGTLVDGNVTITVKKWDVIENKWVIPTKDLYVAIDCTHLTNTKEHFITSKLENGQLTLKLNEYPYLRSLRLYLTSDNTSSLETAIANSLTWEDIGVVANGEDGDMVEYIYYLNNEETAPKNPTPKNSTLYQNNDWLPNQEPDNYILEDGLTLSPTYADKWTDNPTGINETNRYEYVAIRKKSKNVWGPFSDPVIWSSYGVKGDKGDNGEITAEEKQQIADAATEAALNNIENAYYSKSYIDTLKGELEQAIADSDNEALAEANSALERATEVNNALDTLRALLVNEEGKLNESVLNVNDIYELSLAGLGKDAEELLKGDVIATDSVWAQHVIGLVGKFGTIKAENIDGTEISGFTVQSVKEDEDGTIIKGEGWKLESNGSGHLANNNIHWDEDGNIEFGSNVKLTWSSISDAVTNNFEISEGLDENDVTTIINKTTISGNNIATGSITTNQLASGAVTADKIEAGTITADKIATGVLTADTVIGDELVGRTIKSTGDSWEINKNGDGYLAKGNISWDEDGDLTVKGNIETTAGSKIGSWYTWADGTISTAEDLSTTNPMIKFDSDGSGHLCYENISWDESGNLFLGSLTGAEGEIPTVTIGDGAWITTADGSVKAANNNAMFRSDGSGYLGGYENQQCKGLSWDTNGNVTINSQLKYNFQIIEVDKTDIDETRPSSFQLRVSDVNKYLVRDNASSTGSSLTSKYGIQLSWWASKIERGSLVEVDITNGSSDTIVIKGISQNFSGDNKSVIYAPFRKSHDYELPQNNFTLGEISYNEGITSNQIYLLPGTNIQLQLYKDNNDTIIGYIKNIGSFQLVSSDTSGILNSTNILCSIAPEHNNIPINNINLDSIEDDKQYARFMLNYIYEYSYDPNVADFITYCKNNEVNLKLCTNISNYINNGSIFKVGLTSDGLLTNDIDFLNSDYKLNHTEFYKLNVNNGYAWSDLTVSNIKSQYKIIIDQKFKDSNIPYFVQLSYYIPEYNKLISSKFIDLTDATLSFNNSFEFEDEEKKVLRSTLLNATGKQLNIHAYLTFKHKINIREVNTSNLYFNVNEINVFDNSSVTKNIIVDFNNNQYNWNTTSVKSEDNWIHVVKLDDSQYTIHIDENVSGSRTGSIILSYEYDGKTTTRILPVQQGGAV